MNHDGNWHQRQWERIEDEYGEPARDVVRVFHIEMRVPLCRVAEMLYVSEATIRRWCQMWDLPTRKRGYVKRDVPGKVQLRARLLGYDSVSQAIADMRADGKQWEDIQLKLRCSSSTVSRYMPEAAKGHYHLSEEGRQVKSETRRRLNEEGRRGEFPDLALVSPRYWRAN